jgi:hypothetical protein
MGALQSSIKRFEISLNYKDCFRPRSTPLLAGWSFDIGFYDIIEKGESLTKIKLFN